LVRAQDLDISQRAINQILDNRNDVILEIKHQVIEAVCHGG
jgi:hypothetical protein